MMRLFNRFYALCAVAACTILYSAWFLMWRTYGDVVPVTSEHFQTASTFDQRLVVFGDSWSDNDTEEPQGRVWTDWLCSMFDCHQENLAQTAKSVLRGKYAGSVVDNDELDLLGRLSQTKLADFKTQLQRWLDAESPALEGLSEEQIHSRQERTIFIVSFGLWDVWSLVTNAKDYNSAVSSADRRIKTLVEQLDKLSERWGSTSLKVILMQTVDVTFLPGFMTSGGDEYKNAVRIVAEWNKRLRQAAEDWQRGVIYLFDTNAFVLDRIRDWQLYAAGIEEENGLGKNLDPGWENVSDACVEIGSGLEVIKSKEEKMCEHPEKYLFWNEMHLGPSAHRLIALEIYHEIDGKLSNRKEPTPESGSQSESGSGSEPETESTAESETELPTERHSRRGSAA